MPFYYYNKEKITLKKTEDGRFIVPVDQKSTYDSIEIFVNESEQLEAINSYANTALISTRSESAIGLLELKDSLNQHVPKSRRGVQDELKVYQLFQTVDECPLGVSDEFFVKLTKADVLKNEAFNDLLKKYKVVQVKKIPNRRNTYLFKVGEGDSEVILQTINFFHEQLQFFKFAHPNFLIPIEFSNQDKYYKKQWAINPQAKLDNGNIADVNINIISAWQRILDAKIKLHPVSIYVLDKGIHSHVDYKIDIDGGASASQRHGTNVIGIIGAISNNGAGIAGLEPWPVGQSAKDGKFKITGVNFPTRYDNLSADQDYIDLAVFIEITLSEAFLGADGPKVINMSFNFPASMSIPVLDELFKSIARNCVVCNSAGNYKKNSHEKVVKYPAHKSSIFGVAACTPKGRWVNPKEANSDWGSCYGKGIDICAPGMEIFTTSNNNKYRKDFDGTSAAVAFVTGVVALLYAVKPDLTVTEVKDLIRTSASGSVKAIVDNAEANNPKDYIGHGLLDAGAALDLLLDRYLDLVQQDA